MLQNCMTIGFPIGGTGKGAWMRSPSLCGRLLQLAAESNWSYQAFDKFHFWSTAVSNTLCISPGFIECIEDVASAASLVSRYDVV